MNGLRKFGRILMVMLMLVAVALAMMPQEAEAQVTATSPVDALTNGTLVVIAASVQSNLVASSAVAVDVSPGRGFTSQPKISSTNASTAQVGIAWAFSVDGSTWSTIEYWQIGTLNGTTAIVPYTNFASSLIGNARKAKITKITNGHNASLFVTNVLASP
jgi:hypothetical protein